MEFLTRHQLLRLPGGVTVLVNKKLAHEELLARLAKPWSLWAMDGLQVDHDGKNRLGHGPMPVGLERVQVFLKEFLPKSKIDTALSWRRQSRAETAFLAGLDLLRLGIPTPEPFAAVTVRRAGWVRRSWLMTSWMPAMTSLRDVMDHPERHANLTAVWPWEALLDALGQLLRRMIDARICHRDLSLRNILVESKPDPPKGPPRLTVIDLNRVLVLEPARWTQALATRNVERLRLEPKDFERVLRAAFPGPGEYEAARPAYEASRQRHVRYKALKKLPRGRRR